MPLQNFLVKPSSEIKKKNRERLETVGKRIKCKVRHYKMSLLSLPDEILEQILIQNGLKAEDICKISQTCRRFREITQRSATIWRRLFTRHFPDIALDLENVVEFPPHQFWNDKFVIRYKLGSDTKEMVKGMSPKHFNRPFLSNIHMETFVEIDYNSDNSGLLLIDSLRALVKNGDPDRDLTVKYYGKQILQFARHFFLAKKWRQFQALPCEEQCYYEGLVMISQWFQPEESVSIR